MARWYVSCASLQQCRLPSVRSGVRTCPPFASVPLRFRSSDRLSGSLPSYSTRESVSLSCICQSKGTVNEVAIVQQTTTAVELALKEHSTVLWQLRSEETIDAELFQVVQACTPCDADFIARHQIIAELNNLVKSGLCNQSGMRVEPYGSFQSKLHFPTGDLDLSIEGTYTQLSPEGGSEASIAELAHEQKIQLLKALHDNLTTKRLINEKAELIYKGTVPLLKFVHAATGIHCDVTVGNTNALIHSTLLGYLANIDNRFPPLVRLVKLWARAEGINDSSRGTFSSYALTLMVVFHLQRQQPPILPPVHQLFQQQPTKAESASLRDDQQPRKVGLEACQQVAHRDLKNMGAANKSSLSEMLLSFFAMYAAACEEWLCASNVGFRGTCIDTWSGEWVYRSWEKKYNCFGIVDPFISTDNCARTISRGKTGKLARKFNEAAEHLTQAGWQGSYASKSDDVPMIASLFSCEAQ